MGAVGGYGAEPQLQVTVEGHEHLMLVDTGASRSSLTTPYPLSRQTIPLVGLAGTVLSLPLTEPLTTSLAGQTFRHQFVYSPQTPLCLLGRDILTKTNASILCSPDGLTVTFPDGTTIPCSMTSFGFGQWLMAASSTPTSADIYWCSLLDQEPTEGGGGVATAYSQWLPFISSLHPHHPPKDSLHCTLYYDRNEDLVYADLFEPFDGTDTTLSSTYLYVSEEGVAADCILDSSIQELFWSSDAAPHISLALGVNHEARQLGPKVKKCASLTDWTQTDSPQVDHSPSGKAWRIKISTSDSAILEHHVLSRHHGREMSDHEQAKTMLDKLPASLWAQSPYDVGHCKGIPPVRLEVSPGSHVYKRQYPLPGPTRRP